MAPYIPEELSEAIEGAAPDDEFELALVVDDQFGESVRKSIGSKSGLEQKQVLPSGALIVIASAGRFDELTDIAGIESIARTTRTTIME